MERKHSPQQRGQGPPVAPPVSLQSDVSHKLVEVAVGALALHAPGEPHQAVDVLDLRGHLETLR